MFIRSIKHRKAIISLGVAALLVGLGIGFYFIFRPRLTVKGTLPKYSRGAVSANGYPCADIGVDILRKNGSAVDAAIATLFCEGVVCLQGMGIGGGFLMTIYSKGERKVWALNARETAPAGAYENMFHGNSDLSQNGGLAVAVPGQLRGYWEAFKKFGSGNVKWSELVEPSVKLCEKGFRVTHYLANILTSNEAAIRERKTLGELLVNSETGQVWKQGDLIKRPELGKTLRTIAEKGIDIFYNGTMGDDLVNDIKTLGGIITKNDLVNYKVRWEAPVNTTLSDGTTLFTVPPPGSGVLVAFMLNVLDSFISNNDVVDEVIYQRIVETFKYAYAKRTQLGDPHFNSSIYDLMADLTSKEYAKHVRAQIKDNMTYQDPDYYGAVFNQKEDHGTAHISILAPNGDAVSVTSTINLLFGAKEISLSTGIILNDQMDDFSAPNITNGFGVPPSSANFIKPGKRPLSSMCPSIFVDSKGDVRLVVGAAGGTKITTGTLLVAMNNLWFGNNIKEAIDKLRIHHQLLPMELEIEEGFNPKISKAMEKIGHVVTHFPVGGSSSTGIAVQDGGIYASGDFRREGVAAGL